MDPIALSLERLRGLKGLKSNWLRKTRLNLGALGQQLAKRKDQLHAKLPTDVGDRSWLGFRVLSWFMMLGSVPEINR